MSLYSFPFYGLLLVLLIVMYVLEKVDGKNGLVIWNLVLLCASFLFMAYASWLFAASLVFVCAVTWFCGRKRSGKTIAFGIAILIAILVFFKYTNFFVNSFRKAFGQEDVLLKIILPLGLSFYIFSAISYLVDIRREKQQPVDFLHIALYLSFFPKLISGPLQRCEDFFVQMDRKHMISWLSLSTGLQIYCFGLFKKIVLADRLSVFVNEVFATPMAFSGVSIILAVVSYSLQIYFDFSGYTDMAVGVAKMLDFDLPRNFNLPYLSQNVTEFWKRWHISLSSWIMDYVYIPLGGNRKGTVRTYVNLLITMTLCGLWHGAAWTFVFWGFLHGCALVLHRIYRKRGKGTNTKHGKVISSFLTFCFVSLCWVFFRADSFSDAFLILQRMFTLQPGLNQMYVWSFVAIIVFIGASIVAGRKHVPSSIPDKLNHCTIEGYYPVHDLSKFWNLVFFFVFIGLILGWCYTGGSPFIYGNF